MREFSVKGTDDKGYVHYLHYQYYNMDYEKRVVVWIDDGERTTLYVDKDFDERKFSRELTESFEATLALYLI
jgi:hypothetical protein